MTTISGNSIVGYTEDSDQDNERLVFGIPYPLTIEIILRAHTKAISEYYKKSYDIKYLSKRLRQARAFRSRILMMFDAKEMLIQLQHMKISSQRERIAEYRKEIIEKDEEIRVLEKYIKDHDYKTILDYMEKYLEGDIE